MENTFTVGQPVKMKYRVYQGPQSQAPAMQTAPAYRTVEGVVVSSNDRLVAIQWAGDPEPEIYTPDAWHKILTQ